MFDHKETIVIEEWDRQDTQLLKHVINELRQINHNFKEFTMSTSPAGLSALTQAVTDLTSSVSAAVAKLADLSSQLSALNSEDPAVQSLASQIETQVSALNAAVTPAPVEPPPAA